MARRGNGPGRGGPSAGYGWGGPANGPGWGGPARGIGHNSGQAEEFALGNDAAAGAHSFHRSKRKQALIDHLYHLAMNSPNEEVQLAACIACHDLLVGPPKPMKG